MAEHENSIGASDDWHTPPDLLEAIGLEYDLDPCAPVDWRRQQQRGTYHVPARNHYTAEDNGLAHPWGMFGLVFVNPPFGGRLAHLPWLEKFIQHDQGVLVCRAYTSAAWWHDFIPRADGILFPRGKTKFQRPDGSIGGSPGHGITLVGMGATACRALRDSGLGIYFGVQLQLERIPAWPICDTCQDHGTPSGCPDCAKFREPCGLCSGHGWTPPGCEQCGEIVDPEKLKAELHRRREAAQGRHLAGATIDQPDSKQKGQPCPLCDSNGYLGTVWDCDKCTQCNGTGWDLTPPTIQGGN
jgi:hypothetical protein